MEHRWSESSNSADDDELVRPTMMTNHSEDYEDDVEHATTARSELSERASAFSIDSLLSDLPRPLHSTTTFSGKNCIHSERT